MMMDRLNLCNFGIYVLFLLQGTNGQTPCDEASVSTNLEGCLSAIRSGLNDPGLFWFGTDYTTNCPTPLPADLLCDNPFPQGHETVAKRAFGLNTLDTSTIIAYLDITFTSYPDFYEGCGTRIDHLVTTKTRIDPSSDVVVHPWDVRPMPSISMVTSGPAPTGQHVLVILDAGLRYLHGLYVNMEGTDLSTAKAEMAYVGSGNYRPIDNPYIFVLYTQTTSDITVPSAVFDKLNNQASVNLTEFQEELNLQGPIAVSWYLAVFDLYSVGIARENGWGDNCNAFITPALLNEGRPWVPEDTKLSVYTIAEVQSQPLNYTYCCKDFVWGSDPVAIDTLGGGVYDPALARTGVPIEIKVSKSKAGPGSDQDFTDKFYTLMGVDPDQPSETSNTYPGLHWSMVDVPAAGGRLQQEAGKELLSWNGPGPPNGDPPHGYYFLVYEQPEPELGISSADDERFSKYNTRVCASRRCSFDLSNFTADNNLTLVGAAWMYSQYSEYRAWSGAGLERIYCAGKPDWISLDCPLPCSPESVATSNGLDACMHTMTEDLISEEEFWFGRSYPLRCPNPDPSDLDCDNSFKGPGTWSIADRIFGVSNFDVSSLDSFIDIRFNSPAGSYDGCATTVTYDSDVNLIINPTSGETVLPWHVRMQPAISVVTPSGAPTGYFTLVVVDAGVNILHGLYVNMDGDDLSTAEAVVPYRGALNYRAQAQPYVFIIYPQPGPGLSVPQDVLDRLSNPQTLNLTSFQQDMTLQDPTGMSWFRGFNDLYSVQTMKERGIGENCNSFITPALIEADRTWVPEGTKLSVYTEVEVLSVPISYTICCTEYDWGSDPVTIDTLGAPVYDTVITRTGVPIDIHVNMNIKQPNSDTDFQGRYYTLAGVDPDIPSPIGQTYPYLHWLMVDVPVKDGKLDQVSGLDLASWMGPGPPEGTGPHGYYWMLYEQPTPVLGINDTQDERYTEHCLSGSGRCLFNLGTFAEAFDLELVGAAWMWSEYSDYSAWSRNVDEEVYCEGRDRSCLTNPETTHTTPETTHTTPANSPTTTTDPQTSAGETFKYDMFLMGLGIGYIINLLT